MKYTTKVNTLKIIVEHFPELFDDLAVHTKLDALRRDSDLMEVIGNPKNPSMFPKIFEQKNGGKDAAIIRFEAFCQELLQLELDIYNVFKEHYSMVYAKQIGASAVKAFESEDLAQLVNELLAIKGVVPEEYSSAAPR